MTEDKKSGVVFLSITTFSAAVFFLILGYVVTIPMMTYIGVIAGSLGLFWFSTTIGTLLHLRPVNPMIQTAAHKFGVVFMTLALLMVTDNFVGITPSVPVRLFMVVAGLGMGLVWLSQFLDLLDKHVEKEPPQNPLREPIPWNRPAEVIDVVPVEKKDDSPPPPAVTHSPTIH